MPKPEHVHIEIDWNPANGQTQVKWPQTHSVLVMRIMDAAKKAVEQFAITAEVDAPPPILIAGGALPPNGRLKG